MTKKLIVCADDFGFNSKINQGIIVAHKNGVVTSASVIVTRDSFQEAANLSKENMKLGVGIHLDLDKFFSTDQVSGIITDIDRTDLPIEEVYSEIKRQLDLYTGTIGAIPEFVSSHHHAHYSRDVFRKVIQLCKEYKIPAVRLAKKFLSKEKITEFKQLLNENQVITVSHFIEGWYWGNIDEDFVTAELMTHPGFGEIWREYELSACCDPKVKNYLREKNVQLITFKDLTAG
jgi:predicted glycoside hydrolase/deacetylase ChbG (UPF0249 family)